MRLCCGRLFYLNTRGNTMQEDENKPKPRMRVMPQGAWGSTNIQPLQGNIWERNQLPLARWENQWSPREQPTANNRQETVSTHEGLVMLPDRLSGARWENQWSPTGQSTVKDRQETASTHEGLAMLPDRLSGARWESQWSPTEQHTSKNRQETASTHEGLAMLPVRLSGAQKRQLTKAKVLARGEAYVRKRKRKHGGAAVGGSSGECLTEPNHNKFRDGSGTSEVASSGNWRSAVNLPNFAEGSFTSARGGTCPVPKLPEPQWDAFNAERPETSAERETLSPYWESANLSYRRPHSEGPKPSFSQDSVKKPKHYVVPQACKEVPSGINLAIVKECYPNEKLDETEAEELRKKIMARILEAERFFPNFEKSVYDISGALVFVCKDGTTETWLKNTVASLNSFNRTDLRVIPANTLIRLFKIWISVPKTSLEGTPVECLRLLQNQNDGLKTSIWTLVNRQENDKGQTLFYIVDRDSKIALEKMDFRPYLGIERVRSKIVARPRILQEKWL